MGTRVGGTIFGLVDGGFTGEGVAPLRLPKALLMVSPMERPAIATAMAEKSSTIDPPSPKAFEGHSKETLVK